MSHSTDQQLLRDYTDHRLEPAFAELVRRHIDFVYAAALRIVRDPHQAEDVTQAVFVALAQNSRQLRERTTLEGWLHGTTRNLAANAIRTNVRRRAREQEAATMTELLSANPDANWEHIAPHLDAALGELSEPDRDALLLRYFKNHDLRTVGTTLGISDDAAQKRVSRAVDRLREFLAQRGVTVGASGLAVVISANAVQAAPVGLALAITTAATLAGTTLAATASVTATKAIAMTALQKTVITATIAVLAGVGIYEGRQASHLREQVQTLRQEQLHIAQQMKDLQSELSDAKVEITASKTQPEGPNLNSLELLRLRGEIARLKNRETATASASDEDYTHKFTAILRQKAIQLKKHLEENPNEAIPELQFLSNHDWLNVATGQMLSSQDIESQIDYPKAMQLLRGTAETKFGNNLLQALNSYGADNNQGFPTDLSLLQNYCNPSAFDVLIQYYEIKPASTLPESAFKNTTQKPDWVITRKQPVNASQHSRLATFTWGTARW